MSNMKPFKSFLGFTPEEVHAFVIGLSEGLNPLEPEIPITDQAEFKPDKEYHYYLAGRGAGFVGLLLILKLLFLRKGGSKP